MTKKKWLYIVLIIILAVPVLLLYFSFNGNPIGKQLSKHTLNKYLEETYPEDRFIVDKPIYNFKVSGYNLTVEKIDKHTNSEYDFVVTGVFGTHVHYDGIYYANQDKPLITKLQSEAEAELKKVLKKEVPEVLGVDVQLEVLKGKYDSDISWDKQFQAEKPMNIFIVTDAESKTMEDIFIATEKVQKILDEENYDYEYVMINAKDQYERERIVRYYIRFDKGDTIKLTDVKEGNKEIFGESE